MRIREIKDTEDLLKYLRAFKGWESDDVYDFAFITDMLLGILDNMKQSALEAELDYIGYYFNDAQREFLKELADKANLTTDEQMAIEDAIEEAEERANSGDEDE